MRRRGLERRHRFLVAVYAGVPAAVSRFRYERAMRFVMAIVDANVRELEHMPTLTFEDRKRKAAAFCARLARAPRNPTGWAP